MRKYYTRPCNFYYGNQAKSLVKKKKAFFLAGNLNVAFDQIEIIERIKKKFFKSNFYKINEVNLLSSEKKHVANSDLKKIISKRKSLLNLKLNSPKIMGTLNITPDSFSDGGLFFDESNACDQAKLMIDSGASIIDIGGESTKPGSKTVGQKKEWERIKKVIKNIKKKFPKIILSLDTRKSYVMKKGLENGINVINDVSGLNYDKKSFDIINSKKAPFILNHMQGTPKTMQTNPQYDDVLIDIFDFFEKKINFIKKKKYKKKIKINLVK